MAEYPRNRVKCGITNSPGLTGDLAVGQALSSYRAFSAADDGRSGTYLFLDGTSWEVRTGCAYTHSTFSLSRGTLEDSNTGSAIALRSTTIVANVSSAGRAVEWSDDTKTALLGLNGIPSPVSGAGIADASGLTLTTAHANTTRLPAGTQTYTINGSTGWGVGDGIAVFLPASGTVSFAVSGGPTLNGATSTLTRTLAGNSIGYVVLNRIAGTAAYSLSGA